MNVFISWSKAKSMEFATKTKELLEALDPNINAFVSDVDIYAGEDVQDKIIKEIEECDKLVLCFTTENKKSPWLLFEAGYARGMKKTVIPLLFDTDPNWHSWIDNPMNVAREVSFPRGNFTEVFLTGFGLPNTKRNCSKVEKYIQSISEIKEKYRSVDIQCEDLVDKLVHNDAFVVENPFFKDRICHFLTGFESFELYKTIIDSFMYTGKHLWIFGRKNAKLLSGSYQEFFRYLEEKTFSGPEMDGVDFRCLFLDPESDAVDTAHPQPEILRLELSANIMRAKERVRHNSRLEECFRLYSDRREEIIIRLDNSIIYSRPIFDASGRPQLLTNTGFEVFSADSEKGKKCIEKFLKVWDSAKLFGAK